MYIFENGNINPFYNLALEEYLCNFCAGSEINSGLFMLWRNAPSVIIGRFQDIYSEVNINFLRENNIKILRRNSGGGAVYHDLGNVNYSFIFKIKNSRNLKKYDFNYFADFIINALSNMGISAELSGRNDIVINKDDKQYKISGMAQYRHNNFILCHGTLLYDCDIDIMTRALSVDNKLFNDKLARHGVRSINSRVMNLRPLIKGCKDDKDEKNDDVNKFILKLAENINFENKKPFAMPNGSSEAVNLIMTQKYLNEKWIYNN